MITSAKRTAVGTLLSLLAKMVRMAALATILQKKIRFQGCTIMNDTSEDILARIRARTQKIKNDSSSYKGLGNTWESTTVTTMHKMPGKRPNDAVQEREDYTYHPDPEMNEMAKKFVRENHGRESWKVNGELYAQFQHKLRELEKKMGILIQQPTDEMLKNSAALRDAYEKYKFIEKLALDK